jgi:hypothetical protein
MVEPEPPSSGISAEPGLDRVERFVAWVEAEILGDLKELARSLVRFRRAVRRHYQFRRDIAEAHVTIFGSLQRGIGVFGHFDGVLVLIGRRVAAADSLAEQRPRAFFF